MPLPRELLSAVAIAAMPGKIRTHSLNPNAVRTARSLGDAVGLTQLGVHLVTIEPGRDSTEYHRHWVEEECIYVLSGQGLAEIGDQTYAVCQGDFMGFSRTGLAHALSNTGDVPLVCLVVGQRLEHDVCDYPRQGKRLYITGQDEVLVDLPAKAPLSDEA